MPKGNPQTLRCRFIPNRARKRTFTARDVGRIACEALKDGETLGELRKQLERCVPCDDDGENRNRLLKALQENMAAIEVGLTVIVAVGIVLSGVSTIGRFVPQLRSLVLVSGALAGRVSAARVLLQRQQAANQALFKIVQQEAANAAAFAIRAGGR